jgi:hypothetical protein
MGFVMQKTNYLIFSILFLILIFMLTISGCGGGSGSSSSGGGTRIQVGSVTLAWDAPTANTDGSPLIDLSGYRLYYGKTSGNYTNSVDIVNIANSSINSIPPDRWCFTLTAYNILGIESDYSNEVCTDI